MRLPLTQLLNPYFHGGCGLNPLHELSFRQMIGAGAGAEYPTETGHFDVLPFPNRRIWIVFAWNGELSAWSGTITHVNESDRNEPDVDWDNLVENKAAYAMGEMEDHRPEFRFKTEIREAFHLFGEGDNAFIVTVSGKVYTCRLAKGTKEAKRIWDDPARPVAGLVSDSQTGRTWAFTRTAPLLTCPLPPFTSSWPR